MKLSTAKLIDLMILCDNARQEEIDEYVSLHGRAWDSDAVAHDLFGRSGVKFALTDDDGSVLAAGGWEEVAPGVWQSWMIGTMDGWQKRWRAITKACRFVMDDLFRPEEDGGLGARRLQTAALASRVVACKWYERGLKMTHEGTLRQFAADGSDVAMYTRLRAT